MATTFVNTLTVLATSVAALLASSPATARPTSIRTLAAQELRLATVGYRLALANAAACRAPHVMTGLVVHDITRYDENVRTAVSSAFSLQQGFGVLGIVPGSVAAEAGVRIDDEILAVGPHKLGDQLASGRPRSYKRAEWFNAVMEAALRDGHSTLLVRRAGKLLSLPLRAEFGCGGYLALASSSVLNAWADGKHVVLTTGMADLSESDDEIAFVIAHEMAHNMLGHARKGGVSRHLFGLGRVKRGEIEADAYAVSLMHNAGYRPAGGISFLRRAARRLWWAISLDHPSFGRRIEIVSAAARGLSPRPDSSSAAQMLVQPHPSDLAVQGSLSSSYLMNGEQTRSAGTIPL